MSIFVFPPEILSEIFSYVIVDNVAFSTFCLEYLNYESYRGKFDATMKYFSLSDSIKNLFCDPSPLDPYISIRKWHWTPYNALGIDRDNYNAYSKKFSSIIGNKNYALNLKSLTINDIYAKYCCHFKLYVNLTHLDLSFTIDAAHLVKMPKLEHLVVLGIESKKNEEVLNIKHLEFKQKGYLHVKAYPICILPTSQMFPMLESFKIIYTTKQKTVDSYSQHPIVLDGFEKLASIEMSAFSLLKVNLGNLKLLRKVNVNSSISLTFDPNITYENLAEIITNPNHIPFWQNLKVVKNFVVKFLDINFNDISLITKRTHPQNMSFVLSLNYSNIYNRGNFSGINISELDISKLIYSSKNIQLFDNQILAGLVCFKIYEFSDAIVQYLTEMTNLETLCIGMLLNPIVNLEAVLKIKRVFLNVIQNDADIYSNKDLHQQIERHGEYICKTHKKIQEENPTRICKEIFWTKPCVGLTIYAKKVGLVYRRCSYTASDADSNV
jgi:hypothetical protein